MSEQPTNVTYLDEYRRSKADGSFEMGPETDLAFHESELPRKVVGAEVVNLTASRLEKVELSKVAQAYEKLRDLNIVRDTFKLIEETDFLGDKVA